MLPGDGRPGLRLVFLNSCRTAEVAAEAPFTAVATALQAHATVPAVIAMQHRVGDAAAIDFAAAVYGRLAIDGEVDEAVRLGRQRLRGGHGVEWAVPVLYSRLVHGRLFAPPAPIPRRQIAAAVTLGLLLGALALWLAVGWLGPFPHAGAGRGGPAAGDGPTEAGSGPGGGSDEEASRDPAGGAQAEPEGDEPRRRETEPVPDTGRDEAPEAPAEPVSIALYDGESRDLSELGGTIQVDFRDGTDGGAVILLTIGEDAQPFLVFGPDVFSDVRVGGARYVVEVVAFDPQARFVRLRPPRRWAAP